MLAQHGFNGQLSTDYNTKSLWLELLAEQFKSLACYKVGLPNLKPHPKWAPVFEWWMDIKRHVLKRDWTMYSNFVSHSRLNGRIIGASIRSFKWARESPLWHWIGYSYEFQKVWEKWLQAQFRFAHHLTLIVSHILLGAERKMSFYFSGSAELFRI